MNPAIIALGVVLVIVIVYMVFGNYLTGTTSVAKEQDMTKSIAAITADQLSVPDAQRYSYGLWIYVNAWPKTETFIFDRPDDMKLVLLGTTGTLNLVVYNGHKTTVPATPNKTITITTNFPLQKWTYITISKDNTTVDLYLDGKLVKSVAIDIDHKANATSSINFGMVRDGGSAFLAKFTRRPRVADPQSVWNDYMGGSGTGTTGNGKMNVNLSLLKDNVETSKFAIW
jgi:hypothetical protein